MPKKHTNNFKQLQGSSSPSTKLNASSKNAETTSTVNERLSELRRADGADAVAKKRDMAELVAQRSVPPHLRGILGVPESAPPRARGVVRTPRFRTPGPAPPKSWLDGGRSSWLSTLTLRSGKRKSRQSTKPAAERRKPSHLFRFAESTGLKSSEDGLPGARSLAHLTLKTIAESWELLDEEVFPALAEFPLQMRLRLIEYISFYGPAISVEAFKALTQGTEDVSHLDLAGLVGCSSLTLPRLSRQFRPEQPKLDTTSNTIITESWDEETTLEEFLVASSSTSRFSHLTHLCLSHPPPDILWRNLLPLTKQTPQLTHLSLAYWPKPTLTPNLATATVSSHHSLDVTAGGSHFYSDLDQDIGEAASLLKQLSSGLLRLQWLDLEGCTSWVPALAALAPSTSSVSDDNEWTSSLPVAVAVFTDTWRNLNYINAAQGWLPTHAGVQALPTQQGISADRRLISDIMKRLPPSEAQTHDQLDAEKRKALMWLEVEIRALRAASKINTVRRAGETKPVVMDFGWAQKTR